MDNATTHISVNVFNMITAAGALLVYQSAVSPDLNPIEFCFHQYKSHLKRHNWLYRAQPDLAHRRALSSVTRANMIRYYKKVGGIQMPIEERDNNDNELILTLCCLTVLIFV
jgi:transposase